MAEFLNTIEHRDMASRQRDMALPKFGAGKEPWIKLPAMPTLSTLRNLFIGGYCALMAWEIWARVITVWVVGNPLEPPGLVLSLVNRFLGTEYDLKMPIPGANATLAHYVLGIVGYPILYYLVSRGVKNWAFILDAFVWVAFSGFVLVALVNGTYFAWMGLFWLMVSLITATRFINPNRLMANCLSWGSFTWFNALGIFAPIAGLPFLLMEWGGDLSFMSWVGHILFGFLAAHIFERLERRSGRPA
jgi:hypothetical protein